MHKLLASVLFIGTFFLPIKLFADSNSAHTVGLVLPLSGDWAFLGNGIREGAILAQEDLKLRGEHIDLLFEDNRGELAMSATIGSKLVYSQQIDALISIISGVGRILKPLAARAKIINIGICSETEVADGQYSFINYLTAEQGAARFLKQFGSGKSLGIFALNESGFRKIVEELKKQSKNSISILFEDYFDKGRSDFRSMLTKRNAKHADAWLVLGLSPEIEMLVKQSHSLGMSTPVVSIEGFGLAQDKSPFEGSWFVDAAVPNAEFRERFLKRFGHEVTPGVGHSYDSVMMLAKAFNNRSGTNEKLSRELVAEKFRQIKDHSGVIGSLSVRSNGVIWSEASVKVIKRGNPEIMAP